MKKLNKLWVAIGSIALFLGGKLKWVLGAFKFLKLGSLLSLFISLGAYALAYGWKFAVALVYLIYVHEMGHLAAARKKGIPTSSAIFIPFVGALIALKKEPKSANDEAYLAYAGPLWGTLAFLPALPLYWLTGEPFWGLVITLGAVLNLFNLLPVHPLDGGRIVGVISPKIWFVGLAAGVALFVWRPGGMLGFMLLLGSLKCWELLRQEFRYKRESIEQEVDRQFIERLKQYMALTDDEKEALREKWQEEQKELVAAFKKRWYMPIFQDAAKLEQRRLEVHKENLEWLLDSTTEEEMQEMMENLEDIVRETQEALSQMRVYYVSDRKTKWKWFALYMGLAAVLMAFTVYGQGLLEKHQHLLP